LKNKALTISSPVITQMWGDGSVHVNKLTFFFLSLLCYLYMAFVHNIRIGM
jgi:hypothetical protein